MKERRVGAAERCTIATALVALLMVGAFAPTALEAQERDLVLKPGPLLWGADVRLGLRNYLRIMPETNTTIWLHAGGWWGSDSYYRTPSFEIYDGSTGDPGGITSFNEWGALWGIGFSQGLLPREEAGRDLLRLETWYRATYERHLLADDADVLIAQSGLPDAEAILLNRLFLGLIYDTTVESGTTKQIDGVEAEASVEAAPRFLANSVVGDSHFLRVNATGRYYRTLLDGVGGAAMAPSVGMAAFAAADQLFTLSEDHTTIPADTRQSIGGLSPRTGLGGAVRAVDSGRYDANTKVVANLEVRTFFHNLLPFNVTPGIVAYIDGGYYGDPAGAPATSATYSGFLASAGAGISINAFDIATLVGYTGYNLTGTNVDGSSWMPFFLGFGLHY